MRSARFARCVSAVALLSSLGCAVDKSIQPSDQMLAKQVRALGFDPTGIKEFDNYVVVEGDIALDKADLVNALGITRGLKQPSLQYGTNDLVSGAYVSQITVDLSNIGSASNWADAVRSAMSDYNASGSTIHMSEATPGDITFYSVGLINNDPGVIAQATFPKQASQSGKPGYQVLIAQNHDSYSLGQKEWVMVHELGHTLGLRHDNAVSLEGQGTYGAGLVAGTPTSDGNSVMVRVFPGYAFSGFSQYDLVALRTLYGPITVYVSGPHTMQGNYQCYINVTSSAGVAPYSYTASLTTNPNGSAYVFSTGSNSFALYASTPPSSTYMVYLRVVSTDANGSRGTATLPIQVTTSPIGCQ